MGCGRAILCIIFPPLAVLDKGCGAILLTLILTCAGWIPGVIAAIVNAGEKFPDFAGEKFPLSDKKIY